MKKDKNRLSYSDENGKFKFEFYHEDLDKVPSVLHDEFEEAVERFGSLLVENIEKMEMYKERGYTRMSGVINTIKKLKEANEEEDEMSKVEEGKK